MIIMIALPSCKKNNETDNPLSLSNQWILDSMKVYYYWNSELPGKPASALSPTSFFKSLLNPADRFSFIDSPDETRTEYSSFAWYGFEYALIQIPSMPNQLIGTITLVVPGGPADRQGLKRGDMFTSVNGTDITLGTASSIKQTLARGDGVILQLSTLHNNTLTPSIKVKIYYARFAEPAVYKTRIFSNGTIKVGYIFYNWFDGRQDYDVLDSLNKLKNEGVSKLIIDLRYNPGGDVSSAAKIAATVTPTTANQLFAIYQANNNGGRLPKTFNDLITENSFTPQDFNELTARRINLQSVIILTTGSTASAAELLVNNLKPFVTVTQIGSKSMGKDMASFAISDLREPKLVNLTMHPLIFKLYNAKGMGDYANGLPPDYLVDEFSTLPLLPFGDPNDPLLKKALTITGIQPEASLTKTKTTKTLAAPYATTVVIAKRNLPMLVKKPSKFKNAH
ncbi:S41 family peptidase [Mucilaginibacter roseus]|uniref:S41 family peptidase n=1 Tax=Mucilaginibacter roseus TaxID=1528868 RepID=A0ABS8U254_9SPHI|nr:S41 family peptidase [Mucilaginibacter roseus]MCD8739854.1 S41 family peptidase [Mucilaginibacter roseus]